MRDPFKRPEGYEEYTRPLVNLDDYSIEEQKEITRLRPGNVIWLRDRFPEVFSAFVDKYGQEFADEMIALAEGAAWPCAATWS